MSFTKAISRPAGIILVLILDFALTHLHAQSQLPPQLIDFQKMSGPMYFDVLHPPLKVLAATFSGGELLTNESYNSWDTSTLYGSADYYSRPSGDHCGCVGCSSTITIDFNQKVSQVNFLLIAGNLQGTSTYVISDDRGGQQSVTLYPDRSLITIPTDGIKQVTISGIPFERDDNGQSYSFWDFAIDDIRYTPSSPQILDPVDSFFLRGTSITTNTDILAGTGTVVQGVGADGVTKVVMRIPATDEGESLSVTVVDENGSAGSVAANGGIYALDKTSDSAGGNVQVKAVKTQKGPTAFLVYLAPADFARGTQDFGLAKRTISLHVQSDDHPDFSSDTEIDVLRPPVVLVHGLWSGAKSFDGFTALISDQRFFVRSIDYNKQLFDISNTVPSYPVAYLRLMRGGALGLQFASSEIDQRIQDIVTQFRGKFGVAAVQADVVAHSMGGLATRALANVPGFIADSNYGAGRVHELITIGTPHFGSPLATMLLDANNTCVRNQLAKRGRPALLTATVNGAVVNGGIGDLQGDGWGGNLSGAISALPTEGPFPMAVIAATENATNLDGLRCGLPCNAAALRKACGTFAGNPLALFLNADDWDTIFGQRSDSVVPLSSELKDRSSDLVFDGVIHSAGMLDLNFIGPVELDAVSNIPTTAINLLNEPHNGPHYQR